MLKGAALLTCFNRKQLTLECVRKLVRQSQHDSYSLAIFLVNDGSSDGTSEAIRDSFPQVNIIEGDGSLYWNGGMRLAWNRAIQQKFDFYLWVNDDSMLSKDAIPRLVQSYMQLAEQHDNTGAVAGTMVSPSTEQATYGGRLCPSKFTPLKFGKVITPSDSAQKCDVMNGNLTLIPSKSVEKIGLLSDKYTHSLGDFDYSFRLSYAGLQCWVAPGIYGECPTNSIIGTWKDKSLPINKRLELLQRPNQIDPTNELLTFIKLHGGYSWPLLWLKIWLQGQFPRLWLLLH